MGASGSGQTLPHNSSLQLSKREFFITLVSQPSLSGYNTLSNFISTLDSIPSKSGYQCDFNHSSGPYHELLKTGVSHRRPTSLAIYSRVVTIELPSIPFNFFISSIKRDFAP